jgi:hypothetical protein
MTTTFRFEVDHGHDSKRVAHMATTPWTKGAQVAEFP